MWKKSIFVVQVILVALCTGILSGCDKKEKKLIVYSGKGLERVMRDIKHNFEGKYNIKLEIIYAGSETLLATLNKTRIGDVFIPGSVGAINKADDFVFYHKYVAQHVPTFAVRIDNTRNMQSIADLLNPGVKIAVGNKNMCTIGRIAEEIIQATANEEQFAENISITGSTVNELLDLVLQKEVDAALVWRDMLLWPEAKDLRNIEISHGINKPKKIHIALLSTTMDKKNGALFVDFVASEGKTIFKEHGFGE